MGLALCAYSLGNHRGPVFQRTPPLVWCSTIIILKFLIILNKGLHIFCSHQPCKFCRHPDYLQNENGNPASLISMKWPVLKTHQGTWPQNNKDQYTCRPQVILCQKNWWEEREKKKKTMIMVAQLNTSVQLQKWGYSSRYSDHITRTFHK